jgi:hypothetical protein
MSSGFGRVPAIAAAVALLCLAAASAADALQFGSNLKAPPNAGVCTVPAGSSGETTCTYGQSRLPEEHTTLGGLEPEGGVITSWRVSTGTALPGTTVKARVHPVNADKRRAFLWVASEVEIPLDTPGTHSFPARQIIPDGMQPALDLLVAGPAGASAPIASSGVQASSVFGWTPWLGESSVPAPNIDEEGLELLFNVTVEPDRDHDGYGDKSQDRCPTDPQRRRDCDLTPPETKLTYAPRQDFLASGKLVVYLRANERSRAMASGQIDIRGVSTWGIGGTRHALQRGQKRKFVLRIPGEAREVAARSSAHGRYVSATVRIAAVDSAGNWSGTTIALVRPKR